MAGSAGCGNPTCLELWDTNDDGLVNGTDIGGIAAAANNFLPVGVRLKCARRPSGVFP